MQTQAPFVASCRLLWLLIWVSLSQSVPLKEFASPSSVDRPKFRFPDASVPASTISDDVRAIKEAGGGGMEFLSFYNYGQGPALTDWCRYGFGTPAFKDLLYAALNASADNGLTFDFALGPNQGQGVPSAPETPGLALELVYGSIRLRAGDSFHGSIPAANPHFNYEGLTSFINPPLLWGENHLVAVVAAEVIQSSSQAGGRKRVVIKESSIVDLTDHVDNNGSLSWTVPTGPHGYELFAFYERYTNEKNCISVDNATTALGNGSWMVDHFSVGGAKKMTDFWDENLFNDAAILGLLEKAKGYSWEDSLEMMAALWWAPGFLTKFQSNRGYSVVPCLPSLFQANNAWNGFAPPYNQSFVFDTDSAGNGGSCNQDYKRTLNEGYQEYLEGIQKWALSHGIQHSAQPAYNLPLDMMADIPFVGVPELESLGFSESIDQYRQMAGPAHISGRNVISTEIGAKSIGAYSLTVPQLVKLFQDSYAGGVNTMVIHGFPYDGDYVGTTWPGYTPFHYRFTEMWGPRMPAWRHLNDTMLYTARNTYANKVGVPKVDLAFYWFGQSFAGRIIYPGEALRGAGYTHEYLGADNIASTETRYGTLAPQGPAYKALVLYNQIQITPQAAAALVNFAKGGLPIFIVGNIPNVTTGKIGQREVSMYMGSLPSYPSVRRVALGDFGPEVLTASGVLPRIRIISVVSGNASKLYTVWRHDETAGTDILYLYNSGPSGIFRLSLTTELELTPWIMNAWSGKQTRLAVFKRQNGSTVVDVALKQQQTALLGLTSDNGTATHASRHTNNVAAIHLDAGGHLEALVRDDGDDAVVELANGTAVTIAASPPLDNVTAGAWNVTIESYVPSGSSSRGRVQKTETREMPALLPWPQIPGWQNVSGIGTYSTTVQIPDGAARTHAVFLHLGPIRNTIRAWVNGKLAPPVDLADPVVEISKLVGPGANELRLEVSSTLFNAVKSRLGTLRSATVSPDHPEYYTRVNYTEYGLVGPVVLQFLRRALVA